MAYKPVDRSLSPEYLRGQRLAIQWLAELGMRPEDIRLMRWGMFDPTTRQIRIVRRLGVIKREQLVRVKGSPAENWFLSSKIYCGWMFIKERPRSWKREIAINSLYELDEIAEKAGQKALTDGAECGRIRLAIAADIQKLKRLEL